MTDIVTVPNPVLRKPTKPIITVDRRLLDIVSDMTEALISAKDPEGVGLAAPQIGLPLQIFLARPDLKKPPVLFINPKITQYSQKLQAPDSKNGVYEGCLSIPHHYAPLKRSQSVNVDYEIIDNGKLTKKSDAFTGFMAHIIQHEMDHLNGILFIDHVLSQNSKLYLIKGKAWEEISI